MKNIFFTLLILPSLGFAQKDFVVNANIAGLPDGKVKIMDIQDTNRSVNTESKAGLFSLKGPLSEPGLYLLSMGNEQPQYIFLEPANIKITGTEKDIKNLKVEGSASHKDFLEFQKIFTPLFAQINSVVTQVNQAPENKKEALMNQYYALVKKLDEEVGKFVAVKKSSYVSLFLLSVTQQLTETPLVLEKHFNLLNDKIRTSEAAKNLKNYIDYAKVGSVGTEEIDFTQNDVDGKPVKLSSFKGKYVLVDFWASWCRPCRAENPNVVKAYNKFKNKNFTILSVSLDQAKEAWVKAIDQDNLKWNHVSDLKQWNNAVAVMYHVSSIPTNFLIDPNGKIVARELRGEDLDKKLCELLGCN